MAEPIGVIRWESPPPERSHSKPRGSRYDEMAELLRDEPGRWALVFRGNRGTAAGMAAKIRSGGVRAFLPAGSFAATTRVDGADATVYARYVGGESRA